MLVNKVNALLGEKEWAYAVVLYVHRHIFYQISGELYMYQPTSMRRVSGDRSVSKLYENRP